MLRTVLTLLIVCLPMLWISAADADHEGLSGDSVATDTLLESTVQPPRKGLWSVQLTGNLGRLAHSGPDIKLILHSYNVRFYDLRLKWQATPGPSADAYDRAMNYPRLQLGLMYADMNSLDIYRPQTPYRSHIGHIWTLYGGIQYDLWRHGRWSAGLDLQNGVGYCPNPYDIHTNDDQWIIGSRLTIFVNLGAYLRYQLSPRWALTLGPDFKHYSNGTLDRPNLGANSVGVSVGVEWRPGNRPSPRPIPCREGSDYSILHNHSTPLPTREGSGVGLFYLDFTAGLGMRALIDRFAIYHTSHHPIYGFPTFIVAPMWRWHLLHATGVGLDYSYLDYVYRIRQYDQMRGKTPRHGYSPHVLGLSLRHEIFYKQMSLNVGLGWNIHKHLGYTSEVEESWLYQHVGLRYNFAFSHNRLYLGFNIKAHRFGKVDCVQLVSGWRIGK